jgi:hypothetical protein
MIRFAFVVCIATAWMVPGCQVGTVVAVEPAAIPPGVARDAGPDVLPTAMNAARMGIASGADDWGPDLTRYFDAVAATGATWFTTDFSPSFVAPNQGSFDFTQTDEIMRQTARVGVKTIAVIAYNPPWLGPYRGDPSDHAAWASLAAQIVAHYPDLAAVQIWHEPNLPGFWGPSPDVAAYTDLLKRYYSAIREVAPSMKVLAGATAPSGGTGGGGPYAPEAFFAGIYANGGKNAFTHAAHHPASYPEDPDPSAGGFGATAKIRAIMVANGDGAKQIWCTAAGAPISGSQGVTESAQADHVTKYLNAWWYGSWDYTGPFMWSNLWDQAAVLDDDSFGLYRHDWSPRPARDVFLGFARRSQ